MKLYEKINIENQVYAHNRYNKEKETLIEHSKNTNKYFNIISNEKGIEIIIKKLLSYIIEDKYVEVFYEFISSSITEHDIGKINPTFQYTRFNSLSNIYNDDIDYNNSNHSPFSSYIFLYSALEEISNYDLNRATRKKLSNFIIILSYLINKHHSGLDDTYINVDENQRSFIKNMDLYNKEIENTNNYYLEVLSYKPKYIPLNPKLFVDSNEIEIYLLSKLVYSMMISSDYFATMEYMKDIKINDLGIFREEIKKKFINTFENDSIISNIRRNILGEGINRLRSEMLLECEDNIERNFEKNIFYLNAPTGAGKTKISQAIITKCFKLDKNLNKVFYVFPFNILSDQTEKAIKEIFPNFENELAVVNSITPIKENKTNDDENYLNSIFCNYPISLISHVRLFKMLFGNSKNDNYSFWGIANSIIIIDEVQAYKIGVWKEFINVLDKISSVFNIKVIIMSATLPKLDTIVRDRASSYSNLINDSSYYFQNPLFKDRVKCDFNLLKEKQTLDSINEVLYRRIKEIKSTNKILIEFQTKRNCNDFYNKIKGIYKDYEIYSLTSDDNIIYRNMVISRSKIEGIRIIIVSTQLIEAGVDIDMDYGMKEISSLESEEQFIGRINRSSKKKYECIATFFELGEYIPAKETDIRLNYNFSIKNEEIQKILINKDFENYYMKLLYEYNNEKEKIKLGSYSDFIKLLGMLSFEKINNHMRLIDSNTLSIYIPHNKIKGYNGYEIWNEYENILNDKNISYSTKKIKLSKISSLINIFTYSIYDNKKFDFSKLEYKYGYYLVTDGEKYISEEGKFNREDFENFLKNIN